MYIGRYVLGHSVGQFARQCNYYVSGDVSKSGGSDHHQVLWSCHLSKRKTMKRSDYQPLTTTYAKIHRIGK